MSKELHLVDPLLWSPGWGTLWHYAFRERVATPMENDGSLSRQLEP